jgi:hypothetical protein
LSRRSSEISIFPKGKRKETIIDEKRQKGKTGEFGGFGGRMCQYTTRSGGREHFHESVFHIHRTGMMMMTVMKHGINHPSLDKKSIHMHTRHKSIHARVYTYMKHAYS